MIDPNVPGFFDDSQVDIAEFEGICSRVTSHDSYPLARGVRQQTPIYDGALFRRASSSEGTALKDELCRVLRDGPGILVVEDASDVLVVDRCTEILEAIIEEEKAAGLGQGDHFGENERIWNSVQKVCERDPDVFIDYYGNRVLAAVSLAWLGPGYQVTAQVNNVKLGSVPQSVHRDYHLGFQSQETIAEYPAHAQVMSQFLTLQGAVAHVDMPEASGPTLLLPYSHHYGAGYLAYKRPEFQSFFDAHHIQLPLNKGDMIFFSPAIFHAAGANRSDNDRMANLLQISSAFGRTMETVNTTGMIERIYPKLLARLESALISEDEVRDVVAAAGDGYAFPTNLDSDPPVDGNAPVTEQQLVMRALGERCSVEKLEAWLSDYRERRKG